MHIRVQPRSKIQDAEESSRESAASSFELGLEICQCRVFVASTLTMLFAIDISMRATSAIVTIFDSCRNCHWPCRYGRVRCSKHLIPHHLAPPLRKATRSGSDLNNLNVRRENSDVATPFLASNITFLTLEKSGLVPIEAKDCPCTRIIYRQTCNFARFCIQATTSGS